MKEVSKVIRDRMESHGKRYFASDTIWEFVGEQEKAELIDELTEKFEGVLDTLLIDRKNDPNSQDTARRMAKMYFNELMSGRYTEPPNITAFPNDNPKDRYTGILNIRAEIVSMCSHHHQPVKGIAFIGLIPATHVIGLSKYVRLAQWYARRGTLQEELTRQISDAVIKHTGTKDVGVYIHGTHGCMENRGVNAHCSLTQTTVLSGQFYNPSVKNEWFSLIANNLKCE